MIQNKRNHGKVRYTYIKSALQHFSTGEKCGLRWKNRGPNFRPQFGHSFEAVVHSVVGVAQSPQFFQKVWP